LGAAVEPQDVSCPIEFGLEVDMATPLRMVELECPGCWNRHWEIDCDSRGADIAYCLGYGSTNHELSYEERTYRCPGCGEEKVGYHVLDKSPPEFFLQPHPTRSMKTHDFACWLSVFRTYFPSHELLNTVGVFWFPGDGSEDQIKNLSEAGSIGTFNGYTVGLYKRSPNKENIRVLVSKGVQTQAVFWCGTLFELDWCYGFHKSELDKIRELLATKTSEIYRTWQNFERVARKSQAKWLPKLLGPK
jgi:hypothetical protein